MARVHPEAGMEMSEEVPPRRRCAAMRGSDQCSSTATNAVQIAGNVFVTLCEADDEVLRAALTERDGKIAAAVRESSDG